MALAARGLSSVLVVLLRRRRKGGAGFHFAIPSRLQEDWRLEGLDNSKAYRVRPISAPALPNGEEKPPAPGNAVSVGIPAHPTPLPAADGRRSAGTRFGAKVREQIDIVQGIQGARLVVATSDDSAHGVTSACASVFQDLESNNVCLWLDMNDIFSADNLFEVLLEAAYFRLGLEHWTPVYVAEDRNRPRAQEFIRLVRSSSKAWIIFLNARETPGANTAGDRDVRCTAHLWLDRTRESPETDPEDLSADPSICVEDFLDLLNEMWQEPGISVVLLCRNGKNKDDRPPILMEKLDDRRLLKHCVQLNSSEAMPFSEDEVVNKAVEWTANNIHKQRFLHVLVLMQRPRLLSTIWSPAASIENTQDRLEWVNDLEDLGLVRRKAGGFIWIHSRSRQALREVLRDDAAGERHGLGKFFKDWRPSENEPEIHVALAGWYETPGCF
jgi:hypothetical protein